MNKGMNKRMLVSMLALLMPLVLGTKAKAAKVCFDWDCNESTKICEFDPGCTTPAPDPPDSWDFVWTWGDGTWEHTGPGVVYHQYDEPWVIVTLEANYLSCEPTVTCTIQVYNNVGPPLPT